MEICSEINPPRQLGGVPINFDPTQLVAVGKNGLQKKPVAVSGIVSPVSTKEVSQIMAHAYDQELSVYPVSTGKNWGYGGSAPVEKGCILLDLSKLEEISEFDDQLGVVKIQPGVTQGKLFQYLSTTDYMMDATGAGPDTSLMGCILERGFGHTPMGNRSAHFIIAEVVLADGSIVNLAEGNRKIGRFGPSAGLHELMLQSNLVIVISMYLHLMKRPEARLRCVVELADDSKLIAALDIIRHLKQEGIFEGLPHLGNGLRAKSMFYRSNANSNKHFGWTLMTGIYGSNGVARAKAKRAKTLLKPLGKFTVISEKHIRRIQKILNRMARWGQLGRLNFSGWAERFSDYSELLALIDGFPSDLALKGCYWKSRKQWVKHSDPVQDDCGFRWVAPVLPMNGEEITPCLGITKELYAQAGFEMAVTLTVITPRMCQVILSIYFDTQDELEWKQANQLAKKLKTKYLENGWIPYRVAVDEMQDISLYTDKSVMAIRSSIKRSFDRKNIIAPGRYSW